MSHIGDDSVREHIQRFTKDMMLQLVSIARYDTHPNGTFWIAITRKGEKLEELVFSKTGALVPLYHTATYRAEGKVEEKERPTLHVILSPEEMEQRVTPIVDAEKGQVL